MTLGETVLEALRMRQAMKTQGATDADMDSGLERVLRASWPQTREWKYLCDRCRDYGLEMSECPGDATCGRSKAHLPHSFGTPCWCSAGVRFRDKPKPAAEDFAAAGKSRPMTRWGK